MRMMILAALLAALAGCVPAYVPDEPAVFKNDSGGASGTGGGYSRGVGNASMGQNDGHGR